MIDTGLNITRRVKSVFHHVLATLEAPMRKHKRHLIWGATLLLCLLSMLLGWLTWSPAPAVAGGLGLCYLGFRVASFKREERMAAS